MGSFRVSPRGSQNLVPQRADMVFPQAVFDDSYTLGALFGIPGAGPVPGSLGYPEGPPRELQGAPPGTPKGPPKDRHLVLVWSQSGASLVPIQVSIQVPN